jgi:hypothetical protein
VTVDTEVLTGLAEAVAAMAERVDALARFVEHAAEAEAILRRARMPEPMRQGAARRPRRHSRPVWLRLAEAGRGDAAGGPDPQPPGTAADHAERHVAPALAIVRRPR